MPFRVRKWKKLYLRDTLRPPAKGLSPFALPIFISRLGSLGADPSHDVLLEGALLSRLGKLFVVGVTALDDLPD